MKHASLSIRRLLSVGGLTLILTACGGSGGEGSPSPTPTPPPSSVSSSSAASVSSISSVSSVSSQSSSASSVSSIPQNKPTTPSDLQATEITSTKVTLNWQPSAGTNPIFAYRITRNGNVIGTRNVNATHTPTTFTDTDVVPDNQYTYRVQSSDVAGNWSSLSMGLSVRTAPTDGSEIPFSSSSSQASVSSSVSSSFGSVSSVSSASSVSSSASSVSSVSSSSAVSSSSSSSSSTPDISAPSTPNGLQASNIKDNRIDLVWNASSDNVGVTLYRILRDGQIIATASGLSRTFLDQDLSANTLYTYEIQAGDAAGNWSPTSMSLSVRTTLPGLGALLEWSHPNQRENGQHLDLNEIGGYELRYRINSLASFTYIRLPGSFTTSYTVTSLLSNYDFQIAVYDTNGLYSEFIAIDPQ